MSNKLSAHACSRETYGVQSMFVRVNTLSRIMGLAASTIRAAMRAGRFTLPHVVVCSAPLVRTDRLVDWIIAADQASRAASQTRTEKSVVADGDNEPSDGEALDPAAMRRLRKRLVAETVARMQNRPTAVEK
ncbi:MAG: hypothetical protein VB131_02435 [Burkholderia gladioli]